jgi:hypothetical protein
MPLPERLLLNIGGFELGPEPVAEPQSGQKEEIMPKSLHPRR